MQVTNIQEKHIDRLFQDYLEAPIDKTDCLQTAKEENFDSAVKLISVGGVSPELIEDNILIMAYSFARAGFHAGFKAAQKQ